MTEVPAWPCGHIRCEPFTMCQMGCNANFAAPDLPADWSAEGPFFKDADQYLSKDGANPDAPLPGYGWPLGSQCWWYRLRGPGAGRLIVTGLTPDKAARRAEEAARSGNPHRFTGTIR